jgi:hypothetical protein
MGCGVDEKLRDLIHGQSGPARFVIDPWFDDNETISNQFRLSNFRFGKYDTYEKPEWRKKLAPMIRAWRETETPRDKPRNRQRRMKYRQRMLHRRTRTNES